MRKPYCCNLTCPTCACLACIKPHDVLIPILGSNQGTLYVASLCMLYRPLMHTLSMQFLFCTLELILTYYTILFTLTQCCTEFSISYTMYSTTTQATTTAHYSHYFPSHSTTLCYITNTDIYPFSICVHA